MEKCNKVKGLGLRIIFGLFFLLGCARVSIETQKPIQLDVTMRVDIYQHVAKDVDSIEDMISSPKEKSASGQMSFRWGISNAYAEEENYPESVKEAIERRKARRDDLLKEELKGVVGENSRGFVEVRQASAVDSKTTDLVEAENADRKMIYAYVAQKNGASLDETAKLFSKRIQADVPAGTPIETGEGQWVAK